MSLATNQPSRPVASLPPPPHLRQPPARRDQLPTPRQTAHIRTDPPSQTRDQQQHRPAITTSNQDQQTRDACQPGLARVDRQPPSFDGPPRSAAEPEPEPGPGTGTGTRNWLRIRA
ncbi:hypothetical protein B2J93_1576 [Marssonina coronariae]|uniref:Uncharacterized protein n=1 Tax=Diplocarpon coronariae TaxID=2795749 RepID=A0A218YWG3_9HELO|nr:hypothetical protein B2J93_1576 [Marssonina coronariae]